MTSTHSIYKEFDNQMKSLIRTYANNNPAPKFATITNVSPDEKYVNVMIGDGTLKAVERFGSKPTIGTRCIVAFIDGSYNSPVAICSDYIEETLCYNLLNNGCFQKLEDEHFEDWTGGTVSYVNYYYNKSTARLLPETSMVSSYIDITCLEDKTLGELSEIMLFYYYIGEITIEIIDKTTGEPITIAPESLGYTKEILEPVDSWHYARTHFLLRDHKEIAVKFTNTSTTESAYLDGVRIWKPDFEFWYPSEKDEIDITGLVNKDYLTILNDCDLESGIKKVIYDIDNRLKNIETNGGSGVSPSHTHDNYLQYSDTIYNSEHLDGKTSGDFAPVNHTHEYVCFMKPFVTHGENITLTLKYPALKPNMYILNKHNTMSIGTVTGNSVTINVGSSPNDTYYLIYWLDEAYAQNQLATLTSVNNVTANIDETVSLTSEIVDINGNPVNTGEVEYEVGDN